MKRSSQILTAIVLASTVSLGARAQQDAPGAPQTLDSVVAIIDGDVLLASDIDEEMRFAAFEPYTVAPQSNTRANAAERLIDRTLILHQEKLQPAPQEDEQVVDKRIAELRKQIPACARYHCETDQGWKQYLSDHGFSEQELRERLRQRLEILAFIELRFRSGIKITQPEIQDYYEKDLIPLYQKEHTRPPPVSTISGRIQEILLQQKVSKLLFDWLQSLREQGSVRILDPTISNMSSRDELNQPVATKPRPGTEPKPQ